MSIDKKNKDYLKEHARVSLAATVVAPKNDDPLRFWTGHPTENTLVDLHPFADGQFENPNPFGGNAGMWGGPFSGRPELIRQLAPALHARLALLSNKTTIEHMSALRAWWRLFDLIEKTSVLDGGQIAKVKSIADLNELHEATAHRIGTKKRHFSSFLSIANDARRILRLPPLRWVPPKAGDPIRTLIPEDQARELKTALKQDWEQVRSTWARNDAIRAEAARRADGKIASDLTEEEDRLLRNWQHLQRIQQKTGRVLPNGEQLLDGKDPSTFGYHGFERKLMRGIVFPTVEEADVAFHLALMNSGWNQSTMANLDGSSINLVFVHPKDAAQIVLSASGGEDEDVTMQAGKPRAHGKTQFCTGLRKHLSSSPMIVAAYLERVKPLREILESDCQVASEELSNLQAAGAETRSIERQYKLVQKLKQGCRSVWLYVDWRGEIKWLGWRQWKKYGKGDGSKKTVSYLGRVLERLNAKRALVGKDEIAWVTPSDFRDIYARWVYVQSGGNILAVMLALGHSSLRSTGRYLDNNIFSTENDRHARRFMTHLFTELDRGRVDLTILAQLVRYGPLTPEMEARLEEYRKLMRSRVGVGCTDPHHPPSHIAPEHREGQLCGTQRCLKECPHAKFLPESLDGIAMRVEELLAMSDHLPRETWLRGRFQEELDVGEALLKNLFSPELVAEARDKWRRLIMHGQHIVPRLGRVTPLEEAV